MNKTALTRTVITFMGLTLMGIGMAVGAKLEVDTVDQTILIAVGSAIFGAALTFFLVRMFTLVEK